MLRKAATGADMHYKIGTRRSKLALTQAEYVRERLQRACPEDTFSLEVITTTGDRNQIQALDAIGSKGVFTLEIEEKLLSGEIALAVHSMKDMPDTPAEGLCFSKAWKREDPRDALILKHAGSFRELPQGAVLATGSKRRAFQLQRLRPDIQIVGIRGNVDTRIRKMQEDPRIDGLVLAAAGLKRLGREAEITEYLSPEKVIPAPAQGVLAIELRIDNEEMRFRTDALADAETDMAVQLERGFLKAMGGDCHLPVGAYYAPEQGLYTLYGSAEGDKLAKGFVQTECKASALSAKRVNEIIEASVRQIHEEGL